MTSARAFCRAMRCAGGAQMPKPAEAEQHFGPFARRRLHLERRAALGRHRPCRRRRNGRRRFRSPKSGRRCAAPAARSAGGREPSAPAPAIERVGDDARDQPPPALAGDEKREPRAFRHSLTRPSPPSHLSPGVPISRGVQHHSEAGARLQLWRDCQLFTKPRGIEAVAARQSRLRVGQVAGQRAQIARGADKIVNAADFSGPNRHTHEDRYAARAVPRSALRLPRAPASRWHRPGARRDARARRRDRAAATAMQQAWRDRSALRFQGNIGMAADGAGRGAGRVEQHGVERLRLRNFVASASTTSASSLRRTRFSLRRARRAGERSTAVTRAPRAASCAVLPPGAAHRSATRSPLTSPSSRAGRLAATSCTHQAPSA